MFIVRVNDIFSFKDNNNNKNYKTKYFISYGSILLKYIIISQRI
jgi:hypothetical protein